MSLNTFSKNHPNLFFFLVIAFIMAFVSFIIVALTGNYVAGFVAFLSLTAFFSWSIIKSNPTKEIEPFLKNISEVVINSKKDLMGYLIETRDLEFKITYLPESNANQLKHNPTLTPLDTRAVNKVAEYSAKKLEDISKSSWGTDVLMFSFELQKNQVVDSFKYDKSFTTDIYQRWHEIKTQLGNYGTLVNSGVIETKGEIVSVILTFDRKKAIENSIHVYETLRLTKNKLLGLL